MNILDIISLEDLTALRYRAEGIYHFSLELGLLDEKRREEMDIHFANGLDVSAVTLYMVKMPCSEQDPPLSEGQTHHEIPFMCITRMGKREIISFPIYGAKLETITENVTYVIP